MHSFDETVELFDFIKYMDESCVYKKTSESLIDFLVRYVNDILFIGNGIPIFSIN